jgi:CRISPR/Cas system-associated endonuclease Cas3-HD
MTSSESESNVAAQLHEYVSYIAAMYNQNPFHNFEHASYVVVRFYVHDGVVDCRPEMERKVGQTRGTGIIFVPLPELCIVSLDISRYV